MRSFSIVPATLAILLGADAARSAEADVKVDLLLQECVRLSRKDKICDGLVTIKTVGDDSIEAIKEFIDLGTYQYYLLTAANFALTRRVRIRFPIFKDRAQMTLDFRKDQTDIIVAMRF